MPTIEEMRQSMTKANIYTKADIDKICELEKAYQEECQEIDEQIADIDANYDFED